ncbi:HAD hydrolase family protein [Haliea sp. E1-2-M8]|uniref:HAD-IIB family hydrolase n=1 Tax=Haliea sp. E1-2-M8 TaxID=3064706 RepID=UPI002722E781|nr:HAD hydrolase family protein [Haliea sp. E1-2-M8]MDO8862561.1 HAD hydrolase family protein [Haliea sp. E1-2-M8]
MSRLLLVFSDLDGSLLDHRDYSFRAALPGLEALREREIPLIFCSSKTRAEIEPLRARLDNRDPFIVENGAAVFIPRGSFGQTPPDCRREDDGWVREFAPPRQRWLAGAGATVLQGGALSQRGGGLRQRNCTALVARLLPAAKSGTGCA